MTHKNDILLINRAKGFLETMCDSLLKSGYSVHTAVDMRGALTALTTHPVGLIICDNALQDVSGYDFLHFLKSDPLRDSIPFVFFVPVNDQGNASKAFQMGVVDFLVYPMEVEDFIKRVQEIMPISAFSETGSTPEPDPKPASEPPAKPTGPPPEERRESMSIRNRPLPNLRIDVSRDGILWIPGRIKNFSRGGLFVETSLLGKPGLMLKFRFSLPEGPCIVEGHIKHVAFDNHQEPAGMGIQVNESAQWKQVFNFLDSLIVNARSRAAGEKGQSDSSLKGQKTIVLQPTEAQGRVSPLLLSNQPEEKEESIEIRFYTSMIGKQLHNYKAVSFIGSGNMGGVFKGWDAALERVVALKVISYELSSQSKFREMFIKEARLISKLNHPNIAQIYHIGNTNDILYFAMEFISGGTLEDMIINRRNLNTLRGLDYITTICSTLDFLRKKDIIHRDIKPANIMINNKGTVKIVDFGVAQTISRNGRGVKQEGIVGSPYYISPDVIAGSSLDHRSDIYSLGASFYHALTGSPPFEGEDSEDVLLKHLEAELVPVGKKNPKVSTALGRIIEKMMAKKPDDRYQSYQEIIHDLQVLRERAMKFQQLKNKTLIFTVKKKEAA